MTELLLQSLPNRFAGDLWGLVLASDPLAQLILLLLFAFSIFSWAIILRKYLTFKRVERESAEFIDYFRKSSKLSEVQSTCGQYKYSPLPSIFLSGFKELNTQIKIASSRGRSAETDTETGPRFTIRSLEGIQRALQRAAAAELTILEKSMPWLATTASVTPFIGLLGTVLGIIEAFHGLGIERASSIQAVAPGISAALIATAAGLFAAIPAVIFYNLYLGRIKTFGAEMDDFILEFLNLIERNFT